MPFLLPNQQCQSTEGKNCTATKKRKQRLVVASGLETERAYSGFGVIPAVSSYPHHAIMPSLNNETREF